MKTATLARAARSKAEAPRPAEGATVAVEAALEVRKLALRKIQLDGGTQMRTRLSDRTVRLYRRAMLNGDTFPPLDVFYDGETYWLVDGFHRYTAAMLNGLTGFACVIHLGTHRDAVLFSIAANKNNPLQRTDADLTKAVDTLLKDAEWAAWSDRAIARYIGCSPSFVGGRRAKLGAEGTVHVDSVRTYADADGNCRTMDTSRISEAAKARGQACSGSVGCSASSGVPDAAEESAADADLPARLRSLVAFIRRGGPFAELPDESTALDATSRSTAERWGLALIDHLIDAYGPAVTLIGCTAGFVRIPPGAEEAAEKRAAKSNAGHAGGSTGTPRKQVA